jgi:competence protein ComEA
MRPVEIERMQPRSFDYKIDINQAKWVEWAQLEGIGEVLAERIVSDREENGPFRSIDDLNRVEGIGPKTLEKIRPWLEVGRADRN